MDASDRILRLRISGLVQGVGFRAFVVEQAQRLSLCGWVRNRFDSSVEALIAGAPENVGEMVIACRRGPPGAQVESVDMAEANASALALGRPDQSFTILATA